MSPQRKVNVRLRRARLLQAALLATSALVATPAAAQSWKGTNSTDFNDPGNWSTNTLPGSSDTATIDTNTPNATEISAVPEEVASVIVGETGSGALTIKSGGTLTTRTDNFIGDQAGSFGSLVVTGAGSTFDNIGDLAGLGAQSATWVGRYGAGALGVLAGGQYTENKMVLGWSAGSQGTVTVAGPGSTLTINTELAIAVEGTGALLVSGGGQVDAPNAEVEAGVSGNATITVSGVGSRFTAAMGFIANNADVHFAVTSGGLATFGSFLILGKGTVTDTTHTGTGIVDGAGSELDANELIVGDTTNGALAASNGATVKVATDSDIGAVGGVTGTLTVGDAGTTFQTGTLTVGYQTAGEMDVLKGGAAIVAGEADIGDQTGGNGAVTVTGTGSSATFNGLLDIGVHGTGALTIGANGSVSVAGQTVVGDGDGSYGALSLDRASFTGADAMLVGKDSTGFVLMNDQSELQVSSLTLAQNTDVVGDMVLDHGSIVTVLGDATVGVRGEGSIVLANDSTLQVDSGGAAGSGTITLGAGTSGTGSLVLGAESGTLVAPGEVHAGRIEFGDGAGAVEFNHTNTTGYVFAPILDGGNTGSTIDVFGGDTILTADSSGYKGDTFIQAHTADATLEVNGKLGGYVDVGGDPQAPKSILRGTGTILAPVIIEDNGTLAGTAGTTLTMDSLQLLAGSNMDVQIGSASDARIFDVTGDLTLDGQLNITNTLAFGAGVYRLIDYGGALTDNGLDIGTVTNGTAASDLSVQTSVKGQVNLVYAPNGGGGNPPGGGGNPPGGGGSPGAYMYWDGDAAGNSANGQVDGGNGSWTAVSTNFTDSAGAAAGTYDPSQVIFEGQPGTVTASNSAGQLAVAGIQFASDGYTLEGDPIALSAAGSIIRVGDGTSASKGYVATIAAPLIGSGGLDKEDFGTLILTGDNGYTGGTTVGAGTLQIGNNQTSGAIVGNVVDNGKLAFDRSDAVTFGGVVSGSGDLVQQGDGTLTLTAAQTLTGQVRILDGTLALTGAGDLSKAGAVEVEGVFDVSGLSQGTALATLYGSSPAARVELGANDLTITDGGEQFFGTIEGTGGLHIAGAGTELDGANTYTGGTRIDNGALLQLGHDGSTGSVVGDVLDNGTFTFNRGDAYTFAGKISGTGGVLVFGDGITTLTGANTYSGGTDIEDGGLRGTTTSLQGQILDNSHLIFDQDVAGTFAGLIGGSGDLTKNGTGVVTLSNSEIYAGPTVVNAGGLIVLGGLPNSDVTVNAGLLGGYGPLKSLNMVGGTLSPGQSPGTMIVLGNATLGTNSTYAVDLGANGVSDLLLAGGKVAIGGGTLALNGTGQFGYTYQIIGAQGGVTGTFGTVTGGVSKPFMSTVVLYKPDAVFVTLALNGPAVIGAALTPNERAAAHGVVDLPLTSPVAAAVANLDPSTAPAAFDQLSGEIHSDLRAAIIEDARATGDRLIDRAGLGRKGLWGEATVGSRRIYGDGNAATTGGNVRAVTMGIDGGGDHVGIGVTVGYSSSDVEVPGRTSSARMEALRMGAYGDAMLGGGFDLRAATMFARWTGDVSRTATIPGFSDKLSSRDRADMLQSLTQLSWKGRVGGATVEPFGSLDWVHLNQSDIDEKGGPAALTGKARAQDAWFGRLGLRLSTDWHSGSLTISPRLSAAWERAFGDRVSLVDTAFTTSTTGTGYAVAGPIAARDRANLEAGVEVSANRLSFGAGVGGSYAGRLAQTSARVHLRWQF